MGRWFVRPERTGETKTWHLRRRPTRGDDADDDRCEDPVRLLMQLPDGPTFDLEQLATRPGAGSWITVGSGDGRHVQIADDLVSSLHCLLQRDRTTGHTFVMDAESKNGTRVCGVHVRDGQVELACGALLALGPVTLLACGTAGADQQPIFSGRDVTDIVCNAHEIYGSQRTIARLLDLGRKIIAKCLRRGRTRKVAPVEP